MFGRHGRVLSATVMTLGACAAIAVAAGTPGRPENHRVQNIWQATLVSSQERTCTASTGEPVIESVELFQAPAASTTASDPRLDGRIDFYVHSLIHNGGPGDIRGLIDGTAHWYSSDTGAQTAFAKLQGVFFHPGIEAFMGGRSIDDGFVVRTDTRPRGKLFAPFQVFEYGLSGQLSQFSGQFGAGFLITESDGLVQEYQCDGTYQPVPVGSAASSAAAGNHALSASTLGRMAALSMTERDALNVKRPPVPLMAGRSSARTIPAGGRAGVPARVKAHR